jgi:hypothetical protein
VTAGSPTASLTLQERAVIITTAGLKIALATGIGSLVVGGVAAAATSAAPGGSNAFSTTSVSGSASESDSESADPTGTGSGGTPSTDPSGGSASSSASPSSSWTPTRGPNPLGPAAWGLCHAFGNKTWGNGGQPTGTPDPAGRKPNSPSVAYANLVAAAASQGMTVDQYCTQVLAGGTPTPAPVAPSTDTATAGAQGGHGHGHGKGHAKAAHGHGHGTG